MVDVLGHGIAATVHRRRRRGESRRTVRLDIVLERTGEDCQCCVASFPERALRRIERGLREVRERFLDRLDDRLDHIRLAMSLAPGDPAAAEDLRREIHSLIGSAGTLGFHDLAAAAERLAVPIACVEACTRQRADADDGRGTWIIHAR
jgi:hypothetical protein